MDIFKTLGIEPTTDKNAIHNAYDLAWKERIGNSEEMQQLRMAYNKALKYAEANANTQELDSNIWQEQSPTEYQPKEYIDPNNLNNEESYIDVSPSPEIEKEKNDRQAYNEEQEAKKRRKFWIRLTCFATFFLLLWYVRNVWFATPVLTPEERELLRIHHEFTITEFQERANERLADLVDLIDDNSEITGSQPAASQEELDAQIEDLLEQLSELGREDEGFRELSNEVWDLYHQVDDLLWDTGWWRDDYDSFNYFDGRIEEIMNSVAVLGSDISIDQLEIYRSQLEEIYELITDQQ